MNRIVLALMLLAPMAGCETPTAQEENRQSPRHSFDPPVGGAVLPPDPQPPPQTSFANVEEALAALAAATNDGQQPQQMAAYKWLCGQGEGAVPAVTAAMNDTGQTMEARRMACRVLAQLGPAAAAALIEASHSDDGRLRLRAIESMPSVKPPQKAIIERLLVLMDDPNEQVQLTAIRALGDIGTAAKAAGDKLIALQNNPNLNETLRSTAARSLRRVRPIRTLED